MEILSFLIAIKLLRPNGIIHSKENLSALAASLHTSRNTLTKYIKLAKDKEVLIPSGNNFQFINFYNACEKLEIPMDKRILCYSHTSYTKPSPKNIIKQIRKQVLLLNFNRQQYQIEKKKQEIETINKIKNGKFTHKKLVKGLLKKYGSITSMVSKKFNDSIVTGKYHSAKLLNVSPTTALKVLKELVKDKEITRQVIVDKEFVRVNNYSFDALRSIKKQLYIPSKCKSFYYIPRGSKILLVSK